MSNRRLRDVRVVYQGSGNESEVPHIYRTFKIRWIASLATTICHEFQTIKSNFKRMLSCTRLFQDKSCFLYCKKAYKLKRSSIGPLLTGTVSSQTEHRQTIGLYGDPDFC